MGEYFPYKEEVIGSSPIVPTKLKLTINLAFSFIVYIVESL